MRRWRSTRLHLRWVSAALIPSGIGGHSTAVLAVAAGIPVLVLVTVIAVVALGAAFSRSAARRRACLQALQTLLRLAPQTRKR